VDDIERPARPWWRHAAIYQVYPRSFADTDGDGIGDLRGVRTRLGYIRDLGVDALWLNPWYVSPQADAGYDVADYRDIEPVLGTLGDALALIDEAHAMGLRVIADIVPNHCSVRHPWFRAALAAASGSPERERFLFRPGRAVDGADPPNNWTSSFGGPAWERVTEPDGSPGEWYLHQFAPEQPDFNWANPEVHAEFESVLRFWLDRGVDGFRVDVANALVKAAGLPDLPPGAEWDRAPFVDQDGVHEIWREWRRVIDSYPGDRVLVGEVWVPRPERFARYLRPDELNSAFNFDFLRAPWDAGAMRTVIDTTRETHRFVGASPTWVLSNHDVPRHVTRYGRADTSYGFGHAQRGVPTDVSLGTRRARAAALLTFALPGGVYVYQGDELGLWEVEDLPDDVRQDPMWLRTNHADGFRDGCRVPMPWSGDEPPFGFAPEGAAPPWLPQPTAWKGLTVEAQVGREDSMLSLYRDALRVRRTTPALAHADMAWLPADPQVLAFTRGESFACVVNMTPAGVALPPHAEIILASGPLDGGRLPTDTAAWLRIGA
jgi:alpha-glucosidase